MSFTIFCLNYFNICLHHGAPVGIDSPSTPIPRRGRISKPRLPTCARQWGMQRPHRIWTLVAMAFIAWIPTLGNVSSSSTSQVTRTRPSCHRVPCISLSPKPPPWPPPLQWTLPWIKPCDGMVVNPTTLPNRWYCPVMTWYGGVPHHQSSPFRVCLHHPYPQDYWSIQRRPVLYFYLPRKLCRRKGVLYF